ncbi:MAG: hypothetical protein KKB81_06910 [Candidatus Margulisbacteria bacterium]|nr:hypothetical protein [Candidatus Margulisiibacteriota bacterium]
MLRKLFKNIFLAVVFVYLLIGVFDLAPVFAAETYPQLEIYGYKKYEYKQVYVEPMSNYFTGISQVGYSPTYSGGPWQERLVLMITGKLSETLAVTYDLEQQPETPDKYNVKVKYNQHELTFGDITANFSGNEFASISKYVNGVMFTSKDSWYDFMLVPSVKGRSQTQALTTQIGNNTRGPYNLGHGSIMEGTERIELNGILLKRGVDYTIDYFEGIVTFTNILTVDDEFSYSYEYTNILDLFFPSLSKTEFFGTQYRFSFDPRDVGKFEPDATPIIVNTEENFPTTFEEEIIDEEAATLEAIIYEKIAALSTMEGITSEEVESLTVTEKVKAVPLTETPVVTIESLAGEIPEGARIYVEGFGFITAPPISMEAYEQRILEEEDTGHYQLRHFPVEMFSEQIMFQGKLLVKDEDYLINYLEGSVDLLMATLPSAEDPLLIDYQYKLTSLESERIDGIGSRGPYALKYQHVIKGTEKIYIDEIPAVRDLDYSINYAEGKIIFNFAISESSQISASYIYQVMYEPEAVPEEDVYKLTLGTTYLSEKAEKGTGAPTAQVIDSFTGSDVISNNNTLYLSYFPIVPTTEASFTVKLNGTALTWEVDYAIPTVSIDPATGYAVPNPFCKLAYTNDRDDMSDGYDTGTVKLLTTIGATDEVTVTYTYYKSIVGRYNGVGNGSRGPYYVSGYRGIVPGTETVQVWQQGASTITTYTRNSSFDADAGDTGYSINYNQDNPYITFNNVLDTDYNFSVIFEYVADTATTGQDLVKDVIGMDAAVQWGEWGGLSAAYARSSTDQVIPTEATTEAFPGDDSRTYTLHATNNIIENSELVFVNERLLNRDIDYYISYTAPGQLVFYYIAPSSLDAIRVDFDFQSSGAVVGTVTEKLGSAYKVAGNTKIYGVSLSGDYRQMEKDFTPMGGTAIGVGSEHKNIAASYSPFTDVTISTSLREALNQIQNYNNRFSRAYDRNASLGFPVFTFGNATVSYRNYLAYNDILPGATLRDSDTLLQSWSANYGLPILTLGSLIYTNSNSFSKSSTQYDYLDKQSPSTNSTLGFSTTNAIQFTDRFSFSFAHQISEPLTTVASQSGSTTVEVVSAHTITRDNTYDLSLDLTREPFKKWSTRMKLIEHEGINVLDPSNPSKTRNETYHMDFTPWDPVVSAFDHNRTETLTLVVGKENPRTERTAANVKVLPHSSVTVNWAGAWDHAFQETGSHTRGNSDTYTATWVPLAWGYLKLTGNYKLYGRNALAPSGTAEVTTNTYTFSQTYSVSYIPFSFLTITPAFTQEDYLNYNNSSSRVYTDTVDQTTSVSVAYAPLSNLDVTSGYNLKVTHNEVDGANLHKSIVSASARYKVWTWGSLTYDWSKENNHGEVQAGSLADLDLEKVIDTWALNVTLPQNNVILTSIVLTASFKHVNYINHKSPSDNFDAGLVTFEGTLNF